MKNIVYIGIQMICLLILKLKLTDCVKMSNNFDYISKEMKHIKKNLLMIEEIWHIDVKEILTRGPPLVIISATIINVFIIKNNNILNTYSLIHTYCLILVIGTRGTISRILLINIFARSSTSVAIDFTNPPYLSAFQDRISRSNSHEQQEEIRTRIRRLAPL